MQSRRGRRPPSPLTPEAARDHAVRALSRREHSASELAAKLERRGVDHEDANRVVDALGAAGWQSDARYAGLVTRARIAQGYGPLRVRAELAARGVAAALIQAALDEASADWSAVAVRSLIRRYPTSAKTPRDRAAQYRFLAMRGFTGGQIATALGHSRLDDELDVDATSADDFDDPLI